MPPRKIALTVAGGISLGSFEAGALTEMLYALDELNRQAGERRWVLDILTGGSAGSITSALVARAMLYDLPGRRRHLFRVWVEEADIDRLMEDAPPNSLLSNRALRRVANELLSDGPFEVTNPASFAPRDGELLRLSFSLSNMAGVDYSIPYFPPQEDRFVSTFFRDVFRDALDPADLPGQDGWKRLADAAIASGSFPGAFSPQGLDRIADDYPGADASPLIPGSLPFLDGGVFDNEPLREALQHAREADGDGIDEDRVFVLIDPSLNRSSQERVDPGDGLGQHLIRLAKMIFEEGRAQDWIRAHKINERLAGRDDLAECVAELCATARVSPELLDELGRQSTRLVERHQELAPDRTPEEAATISELRLNEIGRRFRASSERVAEVSEDQAPERQRLFALLMHVTEEVANLQGKSVVRPVLIGSEDRALAGDEAFNFSGFFYQPWREYDFRIGRIEAHTVLTTVLGDYPRESGVDDYTLPAEWAGFPKARLSDAPRKVRKRFRRRVAGRIVDTLEPYVPRALRLLPFRKRVSRWLVGAVLERSLGL